MNNTGVSQSTLLLVSNALEIPLSNIHFTQSLADLEADSLDMAELQIQLEAEFGIKLDDASGITFASTVGDVVDIVQEALEAKNDGDC